MNFLVQKRNNTFLKKEEQPHISNSLTSDNFYYKEIARLTGSGGWKVDLINKTTVLDPAARSILNVPIEYEASLNKLSQFYVAGEHREKAITVFKSCENGLSFNTISKMLTYDGSSFWARAIGKPIFDSQRNVIGLQGIFQDITEEIKKERNLKSSLRTIASHNERLMNFANMVTHNVRSQASNLQLTLELLNDSNSEQETRDLNSNLNYISESLNKTIVHLNEIVSIQSKSLSEKSALYFKDYLLKAKVALNEEISTNDVEVFSEFSEVTKIYYNPEFLENIFISLVKFMIRSHQSQKPLVIDFYTFKENGTKFLLIKDNGNGHACKGKSLFDIAKDPEEINNMSHINLFILKNQVEAMHGKIEIESALGKGTTFKIQF